jgi:hypothetical protein
VLALGGQEAHRPRSGPSRAQTGSLRSRSTWNRTTLRTAALAWRPDAAPPQHATAAARRRLHQHRPDRPAARLRRGPPPARSTADANPAPLTGIERRRAVRPLRHSTGWGAATAAGVVAAAAARGARGRGARGGVRVDLRSRSRGSDPGGLILQ